MQNTSEKISLNGEWKYITDASGEYSYDEIKNKIAEGEFKESMHIPQNWQLAGLNNFNGSVWFEKEFKAERSEDLIKILKFHGVDYFADVWLNDNYLGGHKGYFQPFYFNITDFIKEQTNLLVVRVTSPREDPGTVWPLRKKIIKGIFNHHDCRPGGWSPEHGQDQNTGGIWNNVELISAKNIYLDHIKITSKLNQNNSTANVLTEILCESSLDNLLTDEFTFLLKAPSGQSNTFTFTKNINHGKNKILISFKIDNPELWWSWDTGNQNIYYLTVSVKGSNILNSAFGIKDVKLDKDSQFFLNNKRLFLRGTNIIPAQLLSSLTDERIKMQVSEMKAANINAVRIHAHVNRQEFLDECDRQGIIVWQDFALQWTYDESAEFIADACEQIKDMVRLHYNHPSIAFWCCHNEPGEQINTLDSFLYDAVLSEDNTRIIRKASNYEEHPYDGWYWGKAEHFEAAPMGPIVSEFGAQGIPFKNSLTQFLPDQAIFSPDWSLWKYHNFQYVQTFLIAGVKKGNNIEELIENSQDYQAYLIKTAIDSYRRKKNNCITAIFQFMFIDCWPSITWSIVDFYGNKKKAYDVLKMAYQPVYLSVKLRQQIYFPGDKLNLDMWLINDTYKEYDDLRISLSISGSCIWDLKGVKLGKDNIIKYDWEKFNILIPGIMNKGKHDLQFTISDEIEKTDISFNELKIEIVEPEQINKD